MNRTSAAVAAMVSGKFPRAMYMVMQYATVAVQSKYGTFMNLIPKTRCEA